MRKRSNNLFLGLVVLLVSVLVACSSDNGEETSSNGESTNDDAVELKFWKSEDVGRADYQAFMDVVEKFDEEHPKIDLQVDTTPNADYRTRLNTQAAGGQLPDVFQVWPGAELEPLVDGGVLQPINDIVSHWTEETGLLDEEDFEDFSVEGDTYAVPANTNPTNMVFYDKDMLADAGYDEFPETYDEFLQLIDDLKGNDITPIALGNSDAWVLQSVYISTIADRFTGNDFLEDVANGERAFTDSDFVQSLEVIDELVKKEAFNEDLNTIDSTQMVDYFLQGRTAMVIDGNWGISSILENKPEDKNIGVSMIPLNDKKTISTVAGTGVAINSELEGEKLEAAHTFLQYVYDQELWEELIKVGRPIIANVEVPDDAELNPLTEEMLEVIAESEPAPVYDATLTPAVNDQLENELQSITVGGSTPEEAAENIQRVAETELE
ncbi:carbohydrate ABC transporter substrate-binding protein, CUT1 family (TC 3.A.1.1.-) [Gracilibacillus orientalis]|uniref:Carbohydrate ABC transporter substrate-binding protein, CUT1 family (TC 3.A.1.1.-) n=1 Tax=Gracilibacillus orientalis TaxID=334253 RepID=A0A1I4HVK7_9BACI|nr:extracellular solute-binding protein [Gracilibacillus orientalis]SFL45793.1 carbohydrate ABC transporter substrate-binding protein, CUT1 family (TC 3.A.1.1.-) [Gracilibacillus orientalis]